MKYLDGGGYNEEDAYYLFDSISQMNRENVEELLSQDKSLAGTPYSFNGQAELKPLQLAENIRRDFENIINPHVNEFNNADKDLSEAISKLKSAEKEFEVASKRFDDAERNVRSITSEYNPKIIAIESIIDLIKLYEGSSDGRSRNRKRKKVMSKRKSKKKKAQKRKSKTKKSF
jgi:hypothetical protein